jgi:hypothetical protein
MWLPKGTEQFDLGAAVHHHLQPGILSQPGGAVIIDADLSPKDFAPISRL